MQVKIKKLSPNVKLPSYAHPGDAGLDLFSQEDAVIEPGERRIFNLGFALEFPFDYVALVKDKGSLPKEDGLHTLAGVFDAGFRGEYNVLLVNLGQKAYNIAVGQKIAQLLIVPVAQAELIETDALSETSRGAGQFGSTGKF